MNELLEMTMQGFAKPGAKAEEVKTINTVKLLLYSKKGRQFLVDTVLGRERKPVTGIFVQKNKV